MPLTLVAYANYSDKNEEQLPFNSTRRMDSVQIDRRRIVHVCRRANYKFDDKKKSFYLYFLSICARTYFDPFIGYFL